MPRYGPKLERRPQLSILFSGGRFSRRESEGNPHQFRFNHRGGWQLRRPLPDLLSHVSTWRGSRDTQIICDIIHWLIFSCTYWSKLSLSIITKVEVMWKAEKFLAILLASKDKYPYGLSYPSLLLITEEQAPSHHFSSKWNQQAPFSRSLLQAQAAKYYILMMALSTS